MRQIHESITLFKRLFHSENKVNPDLDFLNADNCKCVKG